MMDEKSLRIRKIGESIIYIGLCLMTLGIVYLFRIVLTKAIIFAKEQMEEKK